MVRDDAADNGSDADQGMEHEADGEIERRPGQDRRGLKVHRSKERADVIEIAQRLRTVATASHPQRQPDDDVVDPRGASYSSRWEPMRTRTLLRIASSRAWKANRAQP